MQTGITKEEALSLLQEAMLEPLGLLVYASEPQPFIQALYRAKRLDPSLNDIQIRQNPEGIAICHEPYQSDLDSNLDSGYAGGLAEDAEEGQSLSDVETDQDESDDQAFY